MLDDLTQAPKPDPGTVRESPDWAAEPDVLELPTEALERMRELITATAPPNDKLRAAAKRHAR